MSILKDFIDALKAFKTVIGNLQADIDRYAYPDQRNWLILLLGKQGLWVTTQYRISRWVHFYCHIPILRQLLKIICFFWQKLIEIVTGAEIPNRADIGKGLYLPHTNGIVIHTDAKLGNYCDIAQQVTIGVGVRGNQGGTPVLGSRVFVAPGAKIFGQIKIGDDVAIGANAVVRSDVPDHAVAVGVPAKVISFQGSKGIIHLPDHLIE